jgi:phosphohistidine swiveling domain-containing protein
MIPQKVELAFTRDFSLCLLDFWHLFLEDGMAKTFGKGMETQIVRFTGRAMEFFRAIDDYNAMRGAVIERSPDDVLFSLKARKAYGQTAHRIRELLARFSDAPLSERLNAVPESFELCKAFYPFLVLSYYLPEKWKNPFLDRHPGQEVVVERWLEARRETEGIFELLDGFWQAMAGELLEQRGRDPAARRHVRYREFLQMISGGSAPSVEILSWRARGYILYNGEVIFNKDCSTFLQERGYFYEDPAAGMKGNELHGTVACRGGVIRGTVQLILNPDEVGHFREGSILVTTMTEPRFLPAMKKAAAMITDEGGMTCHAAIVSRELGIPCVIGTEIATRVLADGDSVEVDTEKAIVRILENKVTQSFQP